MNTSIIVAVLGLIGSVAAVIIANRYTARTARRAADATERMEERKLDASTWKDQYEGWREDALKLRELRDADQARYEADRAALGSQAQRVQRQDRPAPGRSSPSWPGSGRRSRRTWTRWSPGAGSWWHLLRQAGVAYPPVPPGITDTDPRGFRAIYDRRPAPPPHRPRPSVAAGGARRAARAVDGCRSSGSGRRRQPEVEQQAQVDEQVGGQPDELRGPPQVRLDQDHREAQGDRRDEGPGDRERVALPHGARRCARSSTRETCTGTGSDGRCHSSDWSVCSRADSSR
jgi:hypothetical protein